MSPRFAARVFGLGAALALGVASARGARGAEGTPAAASTIAVLCAPGDRFGRQVVAELEALGFRVVLVDVAAEPATRASLEASARKEGAIAAIRAVPSDRGVEVWIADRVTGKTVLREMTGDGAAADRDAALAIRTVELLRASLLEAALPSSPPGEVTATPEIVEKLHVPGPGALAARPAPTLRASLSPGVLLSAGGFGPSAALDVSLAWMPSEHVGVTAFATIPLTRPEVTSLPGTFVVGSADLTVVLAGAGARFLFTGRSSRWAPTGDVGVTLVSLRSRGTASAPSVATTVSAVTAAPFVRLGLAFAVTPYFRLRADALAGMVTQGVSIQFGMQEVATWGQPFVLPSAGVDFGWF